MTLGPQNESMSFQSIGMATNINTDIVDTYVILTDLPADAGCCIQKMRLPATRSALAWDKFYYSKICLFPIKIIKKASEKVVFLKNVIIFALKGIALDHQKPPMQKFLQFFPKLVKPRRFCIILQNRSLMICSTIRQIWCNSFGF